MARLEAKVALKIILDRLHDLEIDDSKKVPAEVIDKGYRAVNKVHK